MKKQKEIKIIKRGSFDVNTLSEQEQKTFYKPPFAFTIKNNPNQTPFECSI